MSDINCHRFLTFNFIKPLAYDICRFLYMNTVHCLNDITRGNLVVIYTNLFQGKLNYHPLPRSTESNPIKALPELNNYALETRRSKIE